VRPTLASPASFEANHYKDIVSSVQALSADCALRVSTSILYPAQSTIYIVHFFMAFDFKLSLSIGAASRYLTQGASSMNDWLNDEVNLVKQEDAITESQNVLKQEIGSQCHALWQDLSYYLNQDVQRMNASDHILRKVGGSEITFNGDNCDILVVHKPVLPSVRLTITREALSIAVAREITRNGDSDDPERKSERLHCDLDQDKNVCYRTDKSTGQVQWLSAKKASGHILRLLLHY
jgi:hypothetical protein